MTQERGEILANGERTFSNPEKGTEVIPPKELHDARLIRDAEAADPGIVRRTLDEKLEQGEEPTKAAETRPPPRTPARPLALRPISFATTDKTDNSGRT
jgi:hypothetical protein